MAWGRVDDEFDDSPAVLAMLDEDDQLSAAAAIGLWTLCFTWANRNTRKKGRTPGLLPSGLPRRFLGSVGRDLAELLVKHGLWEPHKDDGWLIVDFVDTLPTDDVRAARAEAGRRGAASRWGKSKQTDSHKSPDGSLPPGDGKESSASRQPDGIDEASDGSRARVPTPTPNPTPPPPSTSSADHDPTGAPPENDQEEGEEPGAHHDPDQATALMLAVPWPAGQTPVGSNRPRLVRLVRACLDHGHRPEIVRDAMTRDLSDAKRPVGFVIRRLEDLATTEPELAAAALAECCSGGRPPWCGQCDEATRIRDQPDGKPFRCPECHPLAKEPDA